MTIIMREGSKRTWRQYLVITDRRMTIVEMVPVSICWNFGRVTVQGDDEWPNMSERSIVAWLMGNDDGLSRVMDLRDDSGFQKRLLAHAGL